MRATSLTRTGPASRVFRTAPRHGCEARYRRANSPSPKHENWTNRRGPVNTYLDGKGQTTTYVYDKLDRVTEVDYADGSSIKTTYDANGNTLQTADSANGTSNYTPDAKNRITYEQLATGQNNAYSYDPNDNLSTATDAGGVTTYGYDQVNNNTTVLDPGASTPTTLTYDMNNRNTCITHPNGIVVQNSYLPGGELTRTTSLKPGATCTTAPTGANQLTDAKYTYTTAANPTADTQLRQTMTNLAGTSTTYSYDTLNRLHEAKSTSDDRIYNLDPAGNITSRTINTAPTTMAYNAANQICWASATLSTSNCAVVPSGATTYTFDPNGNELAVSAGLALAYNARNQTASITSGGTASPLSYLGGGQGTLTAIGSTSILNNVLGASGQTTSGQTTYDTRDVSSSLLGERSPAGTFTYMQDGVGSIIGVANATGGTLNTASYDAYGQTTASTGTAANPYGYASGLQTPGGLVKFGQRYYDPSIGRWTQQDSVAQPSDPTQVNRYAYVGGDPVEFTDPTGRFLGLHLLGAAKGCVEGAIAGPPLPGGFYVREIGGKLISVALPESRIGGCIEGGLKGLLGL